ncbi:hypothetical protein MAM1_0030c02372 [Mucor ambiguus]|uniref:SigF-like NTF2-like domain-containing protein n=1 Tax=Mucor ambiguus TaxID=91626 RepID=A0A0C9MIK9_9FUNG|nr:hypothetical protein MAM1_0030c02372 [Mucor ambiguus]
MSDSDHYIIQDLFSYDTVKRKRILEYYFFQDATLVSPVMSTDGVDNIQYMYTVWQAMNRKEPTITNIVFDGHTAVIHLIHNLTPRVFPSFVQLQVPAITTLYFRETECDSGLLKIYRQEDSWTLEGLIQSVPLVSFWYNHVLRVVMGKLLTTTGDIINSAIQQAHKISKQQHQHRMKQHRREQEIDVEEPYTPVKETLLVEGKISLLNDE